MFGYLVIDGLQLRMPLLVLDLVQVSNRKMLYVCVGILVSFSAYLFMMTFLFLSQLLYCPDYD